MIVVATLIVSQPARAYDNLISRALAEFLNIFSE